MQKWRKSLLLLASLLAGVLVLVWLTRKDELVYENRPLSDWLLDIPKAGGVVSYQSPVAKAIRALGTNAVPYLVRYSVRCPPQIEGKWVVARFKLYRWLGRDLSVFKPGRTEQVRYGAFKALAILGPDAEAAIPDLARLFESPDDFAGIGHAAETLAHLGPKALPPLFLALTNRQAFVRRPALQTLSLSDLGTNARPAVPALLTLLNDPDSYTRETVTNLLRKLAPEVLTNAPAR